MEDSNNDVPSLFVWRGKLELSSVRDIYELHDPAFPSLPDVYKGSDKKCPFCPGEYACSNDYDSIGGYTFVRTCRLCGFRRHHWRWTVVVNLNKNRHGNHFGKLDDDIVGDISETLEVSTLKHLEVNDVELAIHELGSHLRRRFADVYHLTPRRFEELVADVYKNLGFSTCITQQTHDKGYDIILLERNSDQQIIVECKRYAASREVTVGTIRQVLGVQLRMGIKKAKIVTTSRFTSVADKEAKEVKQRLSSYELDLVDAGRLAQALHIYNTSLPPLHLDSRFVADALHTSDG